MTLMNYLGSRARLLVMRGVPVWTEPAILAFQAHDALQLGHAARQLEGLGAGSVAWLHPWMDALQRRGGTTLHVHVAAGRGPFEVVLAPSDEHGVRLVLGDDEAVLAVDEVAPDGAYVGPAERGIPLLHHLPQSEPCVLVFGVRARGVRRCTVHYPGFVGHATITADRRVLADAVPLGGSTGRHTVRLR